MSKVYVCGQTNEEGMVALNEWHKGGGSKMSKNEGTSFMDATKGNEFHMTCHRVYFPFSGDKTPFSSVILSVDILKCSEIFKSCWISFFKDSIFR